MATTSQVHTKTTLPSPRKIRSFVRRAGRITRAQHQALETNWHRFGIDAENGPLDFDKIFARHAQRYLEIGFGMGDGLLEMAQTNPHHDYLGIEVHEPGLGRLVHGLAKRNITNVRVIRGDATEVLATAITPHSLNGVFLYFPDSWPKKRHHKRRIVQPDFVARVCTRLVPSGRFELATDWEEYAIYMLQVLEAEPQLRNLAGPGCFAPRPPHRPLTKFERRGEKLGHPIRDLVFARV